MNISGFVMLGILFANLSAFIKQYNRKTSRLLEKLDMLNYSLIQNKISKKLQMKVVKYYYHSEQHKNIFTTLGRFNELSKPLQQELLFEMHKDQIIQCPLFIGLGENELIQLVKEFTYTLIDFPKEITFFKIDR